MVANHFLYYPTPKSLNYNWSFGSLVTFTQLIIYLAAAGSTMTVPPYTSFWGCFKRAVAYKSLALNLQVSSCAPLICISVLQIASIPQFEFVFYFCGYELCTPILVYYTLANIFLFAVVTTVRFYLTLNACTPLKTLFLHAFCLLTFITALVPLCWLLSRTVSFNSLVDSRLTDVVWSCQVFDVRKLFLPSERAAALHELISHECLQHYEYIRFWKKLEPSILEAWSREGVKGANAVIAQAEQELLALIEERARELLSQTNTPTSTSNRWLSMGVIVGAVAFILSVASWVLFR